MHQRKGPCCTLLIVAILAVGCGNPQDEVEQQEANWPYEFVSTKSEQRGYRNIMDLYAFPGEIDIQNLKSFCRSRYQQSGTEAFYYLVLFDEAANAGFPSNPFTAGFASDEDLDLAQHIRAVCEFNRVNGFSKLRHYAENLWDSPASVESL